MEGYALFYQALGTWLFEIEARAFSSYSVIIVYPFKADIIYLKLF